MQSYINYLLSDIAEASRKESELYSTPSAENDIEAMERHFGEVERWLQSDPEHNFSHYCGLQTEQFPPTEKLNDIQMEQVCNAFERLLYTWNIGVEMPEQLPVSKKYTLMVSILERKVMIVNCGFETIQFCRYDPPSCPFGEWCTCRETWNEKEEWNDC